MWRVIVRNQRVFLLLVVFIFSSACQFLFPAREGEVISDCRDIVSAVGNIQPGDIPQYLFDTGTKQGDEFDVNQYFHVLTHVSMQEGYVLDYIYQNDSLGGLPLLYARPMDQAPYASTTDIPENTQLSDFREYLEVEDVEQGYFEYVVMDIMANQFYLFWHANYNDTQIVCERGEVNDIISRVNSGDFGNKLDLLQQTKARAMRNIEPVVNLAGDTATVQVITFTKWGGFYRLTYTISRGVPHTIIDIKQENLVPYDCGVMF
jgi:hypothetical protein